MSKRKSNPKAPVSKFAGTDVSESIESLDGAGAGMDMTMNVSVSRYIELDINAGGPPIALTAADAKKLGRALIEGAKRLDGAR